MRGGKEISGIEQGSPFSVSSAKAKKRKKNIKAISKKKRQIGMGIKSFFRDADSSISGQTAADSGSLSSGEKNPLKKNSFNVFHAECVIILNKHPSCKFSYFFFFFHLLPRPPQKKKIRSTPYRPFFDISLLFFFPPPPQFFLFSLFMRGY